MKFNRTILAAKAWYSYHLYWLLFRSETLVPNFISAIICIEASVPRVWPLSSSYFYDKGNVNAWFRAADMVVN